MSDLSEEYKTQLHNMVNTKSREVVSGCWRV
jgi:hypothetical protein